MANPAAGGAIVHLPAPLRARAGNHSSVRARGDTIRAVIADLDRQFPGMRAALCEETGNLRPYVNMFLENDNVRDLQGLDTPVNGEVRVHVLLSVAGGDAI